ncbi:hypothetical protein BB560_003217 [Smittium megazygosporum]|uniref:Uncharacterized protein n=1 Tax=Smittium megazygosporum TaxID=133381 RepID=A0A2T9ZCM2_9FUNG|nr:hypothetical protein BB560_003217 [Smittium megazygosporum]
MSGDTSMPMSLCDEMPFGTLGFCFINKKQLKFRGSNFQTSNQKLNLIERQLKKPLTNTTYSREKHNGVFVQEYVDSVHRMDTINQYVLVDKQPVRSPQRGRVCITSNQQAERVCVEQVKEPILLSTVGLDTTGSPKGKTRKANSNYSNSMKPMPMPSEEVIPGTQSGKSVMAKNKNCFLKAWKISGSGLKKWGSADLH